MTVNELIHQLLLHNTNKRVLVANHTQGSCVIYTTPIAYVSESDDSVNLDIYFEPIKEFENNPVCDNTEMEGKP